jgi:hypothetical protein
VRNVQKIEILGLLSSFSEICIWLKKKALWRSTFSRTCMKMQRRNALNSVLVAQIEGWRAGGREDE